MIYESRSDMVTNPSENTIASERPILGDPPADAGLLQCSEFTMLALPDSRRTPAAMGHRLSKIVTRTGDAGTTGLGDGSRVAKDSPRIEAIGAVDELNSNLGLLLAEDLPHAVVACLTDANGCALPAPCRVDTSQRQHAVAAVIGERGINVRITAEKLMAMTSR